MMSRKTVLILLLLLSLGVIIAVNAFLIPRFRILNGYAAKKACSCHYISGRSIASVMAEDLAEPPLNKARISVDNSSLSISSTVFGLGRRTAIYTQGFGCALLNGKDTVSVHLGPARHSTKDTIAWPYGSAEPEKKQSGFNPALLHEAVDYAFDEGDAFIKKTRALLIIKDDSLVAERYVEGFDKNTEILGWSMTKSIANILIGIMVKEGLLDVGQNNLFPSWSDKRKEITLDHLLRMRSGLAWEEVYSEITDATRMLFEAHNMPEYVLERHLEFEPGSQFEYSSGTSNLISLLIRNTIGNDSIYWQYPQKKLFDKLGASSAVLEVDPSGNFVLSSYCYATPRDWARLGLLYLNKGVWQGDTLFTKRWYDYSLEPTASSPQESYGAHIWLNTNMNDIKDGPEDIFRFSGFEGQYVYIIPSYDMVIVRMGLSEGPPFDMNGVIKKILESFDSGKK